VSRHRKGCSNPDTGDTNLGVLLTGLIFVPFNIKKGIAFFHEPGVAWEKKRNW